MNDSLAMDAKGRIDVATIQAAAAQARVGKGSSNGGQFAKGSPTGGTGHRAATVPGATKDFAPGETGGRAGGKYTAGKFSNRTEQGRIDAAKAAKASPPKAAAVAAKPSRIPKGSPHASTRSMEVGKKYQQTKPTDGDKSLVGRTLVLKAKNTSSNDNRQKGGGVFSQNGKDVSLNSEQVGFGGFVEVD